MTDSSMNVSGLSMDKSHAPQAPLPARSKAPMVAAGLVVLLVALFGYVARDRFLPRRSVEVVRALAIKSTGESMPQGTVAFQAAGWIEPAPFPIKATALLDGVVESVHVLEGATVKKGELIATLNDRDLTLDRQDVDVEEKRLKLVLKERDAECIAARAAIHSHERRIATEKTRLKSLSALSDILEKSDKAVPKLQRLKAAQEVAVQKSVIDQLTAEREVLVAAEAKAKAVKEAGVAALEALTVAKARADLALSRTKIHAPVDGIVLRLNAHTGSRINLRSGATDAGTVAEIYEPTKLQVRVDVPLADAGGLSVGQKSRIAVEILPDKTFDGVVSSIVGKADVIRNTLQAKVKIIDPDGQLRPEMLAKVKFLAIGQTADKPTGANERVRVFVPKSAVTKDNEVWIVSREKSLLERKAVELGSSSRDGWVEVISGVNAGQQIVTSDVADLKEGLRVDPKEQPAGKEQ